ncbi:MAG: polyprenyl synthetase family protein [Acidobacteria bacterium]|nr:polyprenyl synthetase family protein [Acidobacteriota bacterium]
MPMTIDNLLRDHKQMIEEALERLLSGGSTPLHLAMRSAVLSGGKRYRPLLMIAAGEYFHVPLDRILPFACGLELIHNYSLVHDDLPCMDDDDMRRGRPTVHRAYGEDIALLTGDALLSLAFEVMADASGGPEFLPQKVRTIQEISRFSGAKGMIGGQFLDIRYIPEEATEELLLELMAKKTGGLITAAVRVGGILGDAPEAGLRALTTYGENIGLAFQTRDDILDYRQDESKDRPFRPNAAHFFGLEQAKTRLNQYIDRAQIVLCDAGIQSESLVYHANCLRLPEAEKRDE